MPTVLIIAYHFPPAGGAGVQRTLIYTRYLPHFGWKPVVLTMQSGLARLSNPSLKAEISVDVPFYHTSAFLLSACVPWRIRSWLLRWVLLVDEQVSWIPFALSAEKILQQENVNVLYATSAPYSAHLIRNAFEKFH